MFDEDTGVVFRDVITLALAGFVAVVILLLPWVNPPGKEAAADIDAPGDVMFEASWPDGLNTDVDVWVQGPGDMPVGYSNKGGVLCNLLRDDLGTQADSLAINHEITVCRGVYAHDEYAMNLHLYRNQSGQAPIPVNVKVSVRQAEGDTRPLIDTQVALDREGREITVVRFRLDEQGGLVGDSVHSLYKPLRSARK